MHQQDDSSNGEASFEIVDKKLAVETPATGDKTELSSVSSSYSIPSPSVVNLPFSNMSSPPGAGNLLSNVPPPSSLPDFTLWPSPIASTASPSPVPAKTQFVASTAPVSTTFPKTEFSAAIPPNKGMQMGPTAAAPAASDAPVAGGFMGMVKEAFASGGVLSKMAEKAKNSVDSIITTLDPQMSEYIYSGGDTEVTVISENEDEVASIREAFHCIYGKAWVSGIKLNQQPPTKSRQAIGLSEAQKQLEEKIETSLKIRPTLTIGMENFLLHHKNNLADEFYDCTLLVLMDPDRNIICQSFTQSTPVPLERFTKLISDRPDFAATYSNLPIEEKIATYLLSIPGWRQTITGLADKEILTLCAKSLINLYKAELLALADRKSVV